MGDLVALAARGMPPVGRGVYLRNRLEAADEVGARFVCVNAARADAVDVARRASDDVWLYTMPDHWRPDTWEDGLAQLLRVRRAIELSGRSVEGIIADPEMGWQGVDSGPLGATLAATAADVRVGLTSYPAWAGLRGVHEAAGDAIWYSPQLYGRSSQDAATIRRWWERWADLVGPVHCIPSIAGWAASELHRTPAGFASYLEMLPAASGSIAWLAAGGPPDYIASALREYEPGGSLLGTAALAVRGAVLRPAALAVGVALLVLGIVVAVVAGVKL